ncbi:MAG: ParB/RepB/Spo0J family partition protein [Candidatus Izemoplasmataceae bacterium]
MSETKLGRNIEDLLKENAIDFNENEEVLELDVNRVFVNPNQPRKYFNEDTIKELAESIKDHGLLQPIIVKETNNGYMLVAGERRLRAVKFLGKATISSIVREYNERFLTELAILENIQREDLTPIEEAIAYKNILREFKITHDKLAERIGKSRSYITNIIGLLKLPDKILEAVSKGEITMGHARVLSKIEDRKIVEELFNKIISDHLSVRVLEDLAQSYNDKIEYLEQSYIDKVRKDLGKKINKQIEFDIKKNKLIFSFKTKKDLERILEYFNKIN